ncbi:hypothetical protein KEM56_006705 [Ascosphaera pollenicola]|nr:hypothetical protein KEM56_006705 [Ascosphaera pollenicola]
MLQGGLQNPSMVLGRYATFSEHRYMGRFLKWPLELLGVIETPSIPSSSYDLVVRLVDDDKIGEVKCFETSLAALAALAPNIEHKVYMDTDTGMYTITFNKERLIDTSSFGMALFVQYFNTSQYHMFGNNAQRGMKTDITMMKIAECTNSPILMMHAAQNLLHWVAGSSIDLVDVLIAIKAYWNEIRVLNRELCRSFAMLAIAQLPKWKALDQRQCFSLAP